MQESPPYWVQRTVPASPPDVRTAESHAYARLAEDSGSDLWEYWSTVRRHFRLILGVFLVIQLLTLVVVFAQKPLYTASSTILVETQAPAVLQSNNQGAGTLGQADSDSFYKTQYEILKSKTLAATVIKELALDQNRSFTRAGEASWVGSLFSPKPRSRKRTDILGVNSELIDIYLAGLTIRPQLETRLVTISFTGFDPALSAKIANAHVQAYVREGYELRAQTGAVAQHFLEGELGELEKRLEKSEAALNDYRRDRGILSFSLDNKDQLISERIGALNRELVQAEEKRIALQADVETIKNNNYDAVPAVANSVLIENLKVESSRLEGRYANLASQYTPEYPPVAQLHAQLLDVQRRLQHEIKGVVDSVKSRYTASLSKENELKDELEREKTRVMSLQNASLEDAVLAREVDTNRALYQNVLERIKELGLANASHVTNVSIVDVAAIPLYPSSPKKKLSLVLSGFLGLMLGMGAAFVIDSADNGLKSADEVQEYLRLPNLATVLRFSEAREWGLGGKPLIQLPKFGANSNGKYTKAVRRLASGPDPDECPVAGEENGMLPAPSLLAAAGEAYRAIRTSLLLSRPESPPKTVVFTSAIAGEGKTVSVTNTAIAFAGMVDSVLLVDADLRRPRCHEIMNQESNPGLTEVLTGLCELKDAIRPTGVKGLFLLSAGGSPPNPSELLGSKKMRQVLAAVGSSYDHVLIDSAPVLPVSDSVVLSTMVDGIVLVASSETAKKLVRDACERLFYVSAKILGVVLNNVNPDQQRYYAPYYLYH